MSHVIALDFSENTIHAVVIREKGARSEVEAVVSVPADGTKDPTAWGKKLAEALQPHAPRRAEVLATVRRDSCKWQYLSLPPCPTDDLPDLVRMQIELDAARAEEHTGYDLLPLTGDERHPRKVLAVVLNINAQNRIRKICRAADLDLNHIVPLSLGWPAVGRLVAPAREVPQLFLVYSGNDSILWATSGGEINLFRQIQLPATDNAKLLQTAIQSQLHRSLLGLAQSGVDASQMVVRLFGPAKEPDVPFAPSDDETDTETDADETNSSESLADERARSNSAVDTAPGTSPPAHDPQELLEFLRANMEVDLQYVLELPEEITTAQTTGVIDEARYPLVALGLEKARGTMPMLDFLHPHRSPPPQSNRRTLVLAGVTAAVVLLAGLWQGYSTLQAPVRAADAARAELSVINESLSELAEYERRAGRVRDWLARSPNLLTELQKLSESLRPVPLAESEFPVDQDVVIQRFDLNDRRVVLTGNVASSRAVQPLEIRLRSAAQRVQREKSEPRTGEETYPWHVQIAVDLSDGPPAEGDES